MPTPERKHDDTNPEILFGGLAPQVGGQHASRVPVVADPMLYLWSVSFGLGCRRHPLESSIRQQADNRTLFSLRRSSHGDH